MNMGGGFSAKKTLIKYGYTKKNGVAPENGTTPEF